MKNIHILPTDKPSRLWEDEFNILRYGNESFFYESGCKWKNIYITSDEEIGTDEYYFHLKNNEYYNSGRIEEFDKDMKFWRKIILTTDTKLIADGVQDIPNAFLKWFVKNPSCEEVEVKHITRDWNEFRRTIDCYKIIIPKEGPKQETLEEATKIFLGTKQEFYFKKDSLLYNYLITISQFGAKWQQERSYSEEEVHRIVGSYSAHKDVFGVEYTYDMWFEKFKKKL